MQLLRLETFCPEASRQILMKRFEMNFETTLKIAARYVRVDSHQQASIAVLTQLGVMTNWELGGSLDAPVGELAKAGGIDFDQTLDALRTLREAGLVDPDNLAVDWPEVIRSLSAFNRRELWDGSCHEARKWIDEVISETPEVSSRNDTLPEGEIVPTAVQFQVDLSGTSYEEDLDLGRKLAAMHKQVQFALGDFLLQAAEKHGAKYADLLAELDLTYGVAKNLASIASKYGKSSRNDFLSYTHHVAAAPVKDERLRTELLQRAERDNLSVSALRQEVKTIREAQAKPVEAPKAQPQPEAPRLPAPAVTVVDDSSAPVGTAAIDPPEEQQTTSTLNGPTQEDRVRRILADFAALDEDHRRIVRIAQTIPEESQAVFIGDEDLPESANDEEEHANRAAAVDQKQFAIKLANQIIEAKILGWMTRDTLAQTLSAVMESSGILVAPSCIHPAAIKFNALISPDDNGEYRAPETTAELMAELLFWLKENALDSGGYALLTGYMVDDVCQVADGPEEPIDLLDSVLEGIGQQLSYFEEDDPEEDRQEIYDRIAAVGDQFLWNAMVIAGKPKYHPSPEARGKHIDKQFRNYMRLTSKRWQELPKEPAASA